MFTHVLEIRGLSNDISLSTTDYKANNLLHISPDYKFKKKYFPEKL